MCWKIIIVTGLYFYVKGAGCNGWKYGLESINTDDIKDTENVNLNENTIFTCVIKVWCI